jgi:hypothetical protein
MNTLATLAFILGFAAAPTLQTQRSTETLRHSVLIDASAAGTKTIGKLALHQGVGSVQLRGKALTLLLYQQSPPWPGTGQIDYQGIAVNKSEWYIFFVRCGAGKVTWIYYEDANGVGGLQDEEAGADANQCLASSELAGSADPSVKIPKISIRAPAPTSEWSISGPTLSYTAGVGGNFTASNGMGYRVYPFKTVDCSACESPGWYEIHSLFYNASEEQLCFGIIYLHPNNGKINIAYSLCLPDLKSPLDEDEVSSTTFTGPFKAQN